MKRLLVAAVLVVVCGVRLAAQEMFGLGLVLGSPTAMTAKYYMNRTHALDAGVGEVAGDLTVYGDYLWHSWRAAPTEVGRLGGYLGLGGRMRSPREDVLVGLRAVGGGVLRLAAAPVEIFAEIAPVIELAPRTFLQIDGGLGARFLFGEASAGK